MATGLIHGGVSSIWWVRSAKLWLFFWNEDAQRKIKRKKENCDRSSRPNLFANRFWRFCSLAKAITFIFKSSLLICAAIGKLKVSFLYSMPMVVLIQGIQCVNHEAPQNGCMNPKTCAYILYPGSTFNEIKSSNLPIAPIVIIYTLMTWAFKEILFVP